MRFALQEHVDLLRALALAFPTTYPDLHALTDKDAELDFFNNVAHLQLHRRSRAFKRLANVSLRPCMCSLRLYWARKTRRQPFCHLESPFQLATALLLTGILST